MGPLSDLSEWLVGFADSAWATLVLALTSFSEAIFFPVPPDPILIGMGILNPGAALWLAALVTLTSVAGAVVGHWLGKRFGRRIILRFVSQKKFDAVERVFQRHGAWAIVVAAFTPMPYKVFAVTAGVLGMDRRTFIVASLIGRGARFFLIGALLFAFGESVRDFISDRLELVTVGVTVVLLAVLVLAFAVMRMRKARRPAESQRTF